MYDFHTYPKSEIKKRKSAMRDLRSLYQNTLSNPPFRHFLKATRKNWLILDYQVNACTIVSFYCVEFIERGEV